jgi:hypothetical protein
MPFFRPKNPKLLTTLSHPKMDSIAIINEGNAPFLSEFLIMIPEPNRNGQVQKRKTIIS